MRRHDYILKIASLCYDVYGDDYYAAINVAESIALDPNCSESMRDSMKVHAILEGEI